MRTVFSNQPHRLFLDMLNTTATPNIMLAMKIKPPPELIMTREWSSFNKNSIRLEKYWSAKPDEGNKHKPTIGELRINSLDALNKLAEIARKHGVDRVAFGEVSELSLHREMALFPSFAYPAIAIWHKYFPQEFESGFDTMFSFFSDTGKGVENGSKPGMFFALGVSTGGVGFLISPTDFSGAVSAELKKLIGNAGHGILLEISRQKVEILEQFVL